MSRQDCGSRIPERELARPHPEHVNFGESGMLGRVPNLLSAATRSIATGF
jgi:hypothetical protein